MANNIYACNLLTGGAAGSLDDLDANNLTTGDVAIVIDATNTKCYMYRYDSADGNVDDGIIYITPTTTTHADNRWVLTTMQGFQWDDLRTAMLATNLSTFLAGIKVQYDHIWIPAAAMVGTTTNGAAAGSNEYATNDLMRNYLAFDGATEEFACFDLVMPSAWDVSTIKFKAYWSSATGSTANDTVEWELAAYAFSDSDDLDQAPAGNQVISDALLANNGTDLQITGASPAITIAGTPALGDMIHFKVSRNVGGTDDMTEDAWLFGIMIEIKYTSEVSAW